MEGNRKHWAKVTDIIKAYVDGETIQWRLRDPLGHGVGNWMDDDDPKFDSKYEYRIKPKPKLRPYTFDEFMEKLRSNGLIIKVDMMRSPENVIEEKWRIIGVDWNNARHLDVLTDNNTFSAEWTIDIEKIAGGQVRTVGLSWLAEHANWQVADEVCGVYEYED